MKRTGLTVLCVVLLGVTLLPADAAGQRRRARRRSAPVRTRHCVARMVQGQPDAVRNMEAAPPVCFDSAEEARASISGILLAIDYTEPNYKGDAYYWEAPSGCTPFGWYYPSLSGALNNAISSTKTITSGTFCKRSVLYDGTYMSGQSKSCAPNCSTLGSMDNKASSRAIYMF